MSIILIFAGVAVLIIIYLLATYNQFVTTKTRLQASIQEIGNQLKRQADLIPNLVESVKGYMKDELRDTADKVMYARRTLIDLTADYNIMIVTFPSNLVASMFGFKQETGLKMPTTQEELEVTAEDTKT